MIHAKNLFFYVLLVTSFAQAQIVETINFKGNKKTKTNVLQQLTRVEVGKELDSVALQNDALILSRLPLCNKVAYKVEKNKKGNYNITYQLAETSTLIPAINFWTARKQQFTYQIGVQEFNLFGENKQIGGFYRNNGFHSFSVGYTDPLLFGKQTGASVFVQSLTSLEPLYFEEGDADYQYTNSSIEFSVFKRFTFSHQLTLGLNVFREKYQYVSGFQSDEIPSQLTLNKVSLKTAFDYNKLRFEYQYVEGFRSILNGQYVMPFENTQPPFAILWNDFLYYKKVKQRGNFATRLRLGISSNDDNPFAPFVLDNNLNIRGVGNIIDRGTALVVLNAEYRHTVLEKKWLVIQTNAFIDAGNWRVAGGELNELLRMENARIHPGIGLRFIHKKIFNGVFRIDYGRSVLANKNQKGIVVGIGQYF